MTLLSVFTHTFNNNKTYPVILVTGSHRQPSRHYNPSFPWIKVLINWLTNFDMTGITLFERFDQETFTSLLFSVSFLAFQVPTKFVIILSNSKCSTTNINRASVIRTNDTIIAKYKHFTKDYKASTKCRVEQQHGPREDARITHARPTITAGATPSSSSA